MKLRDYQREDVDAIKAAGGRALILSEPGTGKTAVAVRAARELRRSPIVVVCPASVTVNWAREARMWAPDLSIQVLRGTRATVKLRKRHVYILSWAVLRGWLPVLGRLKPQTLILDELHNARHLDAMRSRAAAALAARVPQVIGLTGTPVVGEIGDLDAIKALWGKQPPVVIRRLLHEVAPDVPAKSRHTEYVELRPRDREKYIKAETDLATFLEEIGKKPTQVQAAMRAEAYVRVGYLRRILEAGKAWAAAEWAAKAAILGEPVVLFCDTLRAVKRLQVLLRRQRIRCAVIQGSTDQRQRRRIVEFFQSGRIPVLIATRAGIEGITLTAARNCCFVGRFWCATEEDQAEDRIHRIGQKHPTVATYLHAVGTLDDRLEEIVSTKREIAAGAIAYTAVERATTAAIIDAWTQHSRRGSPTSLLGAGALPGPLPRRPALVEFASSRWTAKAAAAWVRLHGYRGRRLEHSGAVLRVICGGRPGAPVRVTDTIRAA